MFTFPLGRVIIKPALILGISGSFNLAVTTPNYNITKNIFSTSVYNSSNTQDLIGSANTMPNQISIKIVEGDGYKLKFKKNYMLDYIVDDGYYCYDDDFLGYYGCCLSLDELIDDFEEQMIVDWQMYAICDINELSIDAVELRKKLLSILEEI